jgi:hypothetical protein
MAVAGGPVAGDTRRGGLGIEERTQRMDTHKSERKERDLFSGEHSNADQPFVLMPVLRYRRV